jgi:methylmalonyl-CoA mutase
MANPKESLLSTFPEVSYAAWRAEVERALSGANLDKRLVTRTLEGIDVQPLYSADDWASAQDAAGFGGAPPYRRGPEPLGRHGERWDMRPRYDNPDPAALEREIEGDLARGARSLWLCFDGQARAGRSVPEAPRAQGERGVPCLTAAQLGELLAQVPLERMTVSLDAGGNGLSVAACFAAVLRARGLRPDQVQAWLNLDPLGALAKDGELPHTLEGSREQLVALARDCAEHAPRWRSVTVSVVPHHDAGADAAHELAYALSTGVAYLRWLVDGGLSVEQACAQLAFSVAVGSDFFMEIAKLRALRQCWSSVVAASGGGSEAQRSVIHATTSLRTKTVRDPWVNLLRETTEVFAAAVGGADAITSGGFDRLCGVSDGFARRIAGNTHVILDQEAHVTRVADAAGGAWYVETLTDQLAQRAWQLFQTLETEGGMVQALVSGRVGEQIAEVANARDALIAKRKQALTGVSEFANIGEQPVVRAEPDWPRIAAARRGALEAASKDAAAVASLLQRVRADGPGLVAAAREVAAAGATLGQLGTALASLGVPALATALPLRRHAEPFERLRDTCDARERQSGKRPSVFLCNLGPIAEHKARAQFASGFFAAGGLTVLDNDGFETPEAAAEGYARSGAELCVLCGTDDAYVQWVERLLPLLRGGASKRVVLAGRGGEHESRYRAAGITDFIFVGCDVVATLTDLLTSTGARS